MTFYLASWQAFVLLKAAMPFNFSSPEYLSHHRTRENRVSPVGRASPAHMNSPLETELKVIVLQGIWKRYKIHKILI